MARFYAGMGELAAEVTRPEHTSLTEVALEAYAAWLKIANVDNQAARTDAAMERWKSELLLSVPHMVLGTLQPPPPDLQEEKEAVKKVGEKVETQETMDVEEEEEEEEEEEGKEQTELKRGKPVLSTNGRAAGYAVKGGGGVDHVRGGKLEPEIIAAPAPSRRTLFADLRPAARSAPPVLESITTAHKSPDSNTDEPATDSKQAEHELAGAQDLEREHQLQQISAMASLSLAVAQEPEDEASGPGAPPTPEMSLKEQLLLEASILSPNRLSPRKLSDSDEEGAQATSIGAFFSAGTRSSQAQAELDEQASDAVALHSRLLQNLEASILSPQRLSPREESAGDNDGADMMDRCLQSVGAAATSSSDNVLARHLKADDDLMRQEDEELHADMEAEAKVNDKDRCLNETKFSDQCDVHQVVRTDCSCFAAGPKAERKKLSQAQSSARSTRTREPSPCELLPSPRKVTTQTSLKSQACSWDAVGKPRRMQRRVVMSKVVDSSRRARHWRYGGRLCKLVR